MIVFDLRCYQVDNVLWEVYVYSTNYYQIFWLQERPVFEPIEKNTQLKCTPRHHCSHDLVHLLN